MAKSYASAKVIAIVGPTATGKSELAVKLAKKLGGEIISADSRQIYRGLSIGTGKVPGQWTPPPPSPTKGREKRGGQARRKEKRFVYKGIIHYCIDFVDPQKTFSAADFKKATLQAIEKILRKGKVPIIVGGTGFWIDALFQPNLLAGVPPNFKFHRQLEKKTALQLFQQLKKINPQKARSIDQKNKRRLVRAIEIATLLPLPAPSTNYSLPTTHYDVLYLGLTLPNHKLKKRIKKRFLKWLAQGLLSETKILMQKVSKKRLAEIGLHYRITADYLSGKIDKNQMIEKSVNAIYHYAKRQKTWFKKNPEINWIKSDKDAEKLIMIETFLK